VRGAYPLVVLVRVELSILERLLETVARHAAAVGVASVTRGHRTIVDCPHKPSMINAVAVLIPALRPIPKPNDVWAAHDAWERASPGSGVGAAPDVGQVGKVGCGVPQWARTVDGVA
jgi:hypothetical protein